MLGKLLKLLIVLIHLIYFHVSAKLSRSLAGKSDCSTQAARVDAGGKVQHGPD